MHFQLATRPINSHQLHPTTTATAMHTRRYLRILIRIRVQSTDIAVHPVTSPNLIHRNPSRKITASPPKLTSPSQSPHLPPDQNLPNSLSISIHFTFHIHIFTFQPKHASAPTTPPSRKIKKRKPPVPAFCSAVTLYIHPQTNQIHSPPPHNPQQKMAPSFPAAELHPH